MFFIGQGIGYEDFSRYTAEQDLKTYTFRNFVHPANMPDLLANVDFILSFFRDNPIRDFSNIVCEALWSGIRLITDRTLPINEYTKYIEIEPEKQIINLAPEKIEAAQRVISEIISNWQGPYRCHNNIKYNFDDYINANLKVYNLIS